MLTIPDPATRAAVASATTQQGSLEALLAPFGGLPMTARLESPTGVHLRTLTIPLPVIEATTPRRITLSAHLADAAVAAGTPGLWVFRTAGGTAVFGLSAGLAGSGAAVIHAGDVQALCTPTLAGVTVTAQVGLPVAPAPPPAAVQVIDNAMWGNSATYFTGMSEAGATYFGVSSKAQSFRVVRWPHDTRAATAFVLRTTEGGTDHGAPTVIRRTDGRLLLLYSGHNTPSLYQRISTAPDDISAFGTETVLATGIITYTLAIKLVGVVALFFRDAGQIKMMWSTNDGDSWTAPIDVMTMPGGQTPYPYPVRTADNRIDMIVSPIGGGTFFGVYHLSVTWSGTAWTWRRTDGATVSALPIVPTASATAVHVDGAAQYVIPETSKRAADGNLWVITRRKLAGVATAEYWLVRQSGATWRSPVLIASAGHPMTVQQDYLGGATFDLSTDSRLYLSVGDSATGPWELRAFTSANAGDSWSLERAITSGSGAGNYAMKPIALAGDPLYRVAYIRANPYNSFSDWVASLWGAA